MANYLIDKSRSGTLPQLGGVDIITSTCKVSHVQIFNLSVGTLFVRLDGQNPTPDGSIDGDLVIPPNEFRNFSIPDTDRPEIRIGGSTNLAYSVEIY